jgi:hypothetical protein
VRRQRSGWKSSVRLGGTDHMESRHLDAYRLGTSQGAVTFRTLLRLVCPPSPGLRRTVSVLATASMLEAEDLAGWEAWCGPRRSENGVKAPV